MLIHVKHGGYLATHYSLYYHDIRISIPLEVASRVQPASCIVAVAPPDLVYNKYRTHHYKALYCNVCENHSFLHWWNVTIKNPKSWNADTVSIVSLWFLWWSIRLHVDLWILTALQAKCCFSKAHRSTVDSVQCWHDIAGSLAAINNHKTIHTMKLLH